MNDLLDTVGHNLLTVLPTAYLIWKNILPEKALWAHLMSKAVSVTDCGICFNKLWERFSDQWALTFEKGKTNFTAPDMTFLFPPLTLALQPWKLGEMLYSLGFGSNKHFFQHVGPDYFSPLEIQCWKCFFWDVCIVFDFSLLFCLLCVVRMLFTCSCVCMCVHV